MHFRLYIQSHRRWLLVRGQGSSCLTGSYVLISTVRWIQWRERESRDLSDAIKMLSWAPSTVSTSVNSAFSYWGKSRKLGWLSSHCSLYAPLQAVMRSAEDVPPIVLNVQYEGPEMQARHRKKQMISFAVLWQDVLSILDADTHKCQMLQLPC